MTLAKRGEWHDDGAVLAGQLGTAGAAHATSTWRAQPERNGDFVMSVKRVSRRRFVAQSAAIGAAAFAAPAILRGQDLNSRVSLAFIATGRRGGYNLDEMTKASNAVKVDVVALCDVNQQNLDPALKKFPQARQYKDFRKLLEELKDVDAVVVSTTEHTHAYAVIPALAAGKAVYCEKPMSRDVAECRAMREAARKAKAATQMGTQNH